MYDTSAKLYKMSYQWKLVQKKLIPRRSPVAPCGSHADSPLPLNFVQSQLTPVVKRDLLINNESEDQTDIKSLIGSPFVIRSCHLDDSKLDESEEANRKVKCEESDCNVRGILKISPCEDKKGPGFSGEEEDNEFSQVNELDSDWPRISDNQPQPATEINLLTASGIERSNKTWSNVLKTVPCPHSTEEV